MLVLWYCGVGDMVLVIWWWWWWRRSGATECIFPDKRFGDRPTRGWQRCLLPPASTQLARQGSSSSKVQSRAGAVARQELLQHALSKVRRVRGGKMGGGWLLAFLGLLAVAHGEIFGSVEVDKIQENEQCCLIRTNKLSSHYQIASKRAVCHQAGLVSLIYGQNFVVWGFKHRTLDKVWWHLSPTQPTCVMLTMICMEIYLDRDIFLYPSA